MDSIFHSGGVARSRRAWRFAAVIVFSLSCGVSIAQVAPTEPFAFHPSTADFGTAFVNTTGLDQTVTFLRTGASAASISRVVVGGEFPRDFTVDLDSCTDVPLSADGGCFVRLSFTPKGTGPRIASLMVFTTGIDLPETVPLIGVGVTTPATIPPGGTQGVPALRNFEDLAVGTAVSNQYDGVSFVDSGAGILLLPAVHIETPPAGTVSGTQALEASFRSAANAGSHLIMKFDIPQRHVSLSTGLAFVPRTPNAAGYAMILQGFAGSWQPDAGGVPLAGQSIVKSVTPCTTTEPAPLDTPLEIDDPTGQIQYAALSVINCGRVPAGDFGPDNANFGPTGAIVALDNLSYDRPLHPPVQATVPLTVSVSNLTDGATVTGPSEITPSLPLSLDVQASSLLAVRASVNGGSPVALGFFRTGPATFKVQGELDADSGLRAGMNAVTLTTTTNDHPSSTVASTLHVNFQFPTVALVPSLDVIPTAFEVTQTIDAGPTLIGNADKDPNNDGYRVQAPSWPPLLRGKATLVRIYGAQHGGGSAAINNVPAVMSVIDTAGNVLVVQSVPPNASPTQFNRTGITVWPTTSTKSNPKDASNVDDLSHTWNFLLPADYSQTDLDVIVNINDGIYGNEPFGTPVQECSINSSLTCQHNNRVVVHIHFQDAPSITVDPVLIRVLGPWTDGKIYDVQPTSKQVNAVFAQMNQLYPEVVRRGSTFHMNELTFQDSDGLLDDMDDNFDDNIGSDSEMAIGLYPGGNPNPFFSPNSPQPDGSVVVGTAYVGGRGAWADANNPIDIAHELGHNIGFDHWGCENGVTDDECGVFPIPHAGIGVTGTDIANWRIIPRGNDSSDSTPHSHDFMSYGQLCGLYGGGAGCDLGEWVSWYTYQILLESGAQIDNYDTDDPPALLVRGLIDSSGNTTFKPVYQVMTNHLATDNFPEDDTGEMLTLRGFDAAGNMLFVHNFEPKKLEPHDPGLPDRGGVHEPVPIVPNLARIALTKGGAMMGELKSSDAASRAQVTITAPKSGDAWPAGSQQTVQWTITGVPSTAPSPLAQIQLSLDGGKTRRTLARDVTGNSYAVDARNLPGSSSAVLYVQLSDGLKQVEASAGPFTIAAQAPEVQISSPSDGAQYEVGVPVPLTGSASDLQETIADRSFQWSSDRDGLLGTGMSLTTSKLSVGHHVLTLVATDTAGLTGQDTVQVDVVAPTPAVTRGDLNGDGKINILDATLALQIAVRLVTPSAAQLQAGDLGGDGTIDIADVVKILEFTVGILSSL